MSVDPGFRTDNLALLNVSYPSGAETIEEARAYFDELQDRLGSLPGVLDVAGADQMPFSGGWSSPPVTLETTEGEWDGILHCPTVTPSYFAAMGIPLVAGREFSDGDTEESEPVAVVSQALAQRMAPGGSPLGLRIRINAGDSVFRTVVGVVGDVKYRLDFDAMQMAYFPQAQAPSYLDNWVLRTQTDPETLAGPVRDVREALDPEGTSILQDLDGIIQGSTAAVAARFSVILLGSLAALAALLAVFGVYGVLAYLVQLRSKEIGIQVALGAERRTVLGAVLIRGMTMAGLGLGTGLGLSLILGRLMESQLFGVEPWDPASLATAGLMILVACVTASYFPARKAASTNPVEVMKGE
jgi:predicted permease